jgi:monovalent cation/proton antiporter MnhG/PhaG subunit
MSEPLLPLAGAVLSLLGALFFLVSAVGLLRLPDFYTRAHAPAKAATLGLLLAAAGSIVTYGLGDAAYWLEKLLLVLFVLITVPISTQVLVRSAVTRGIQQSPSTQGAPSHFGQVPPRAP